MATTAQNNAAADDEVVEAPIAAATAINSGDMAVVSNGLIVVQANVTDSVCGVCEDTNPVASLGDQLTKVLIRRRGMARLKVKSGDTPKWGDLLYGTTVDAQTVSTSSAGSAKVVGRFRDLALGVTADGATYYLVQLVVDQ